MNVPVEPSMPSRSLVWTIALTLVLVAGAVLRLMWVDDMEYKFDERWSYERTQHAGKDEPWPWLGMPTSYEVRHPGGTVWIFIMLARLTGATTPTGLATACQLLNVLAVLLVVVFALLSVPREQREPWFWAAAIVAVNPVAVQQHRKIWPPSTLPFFVMLVLWAWWYRRTRVGAFLWGLSALLLTQIHPAGMFFAVALALWAFLTDRKSIPWFWWALGSAIAFVTLIPWLWYAIHETTQNPISQRQIVNLFTFRWWIRWVTESFGLGLGYSLGDDIYDFLAWPSVGGYPTYLVGLLHAGVIALMTWTALGWLTWYRREQPALRTLVVGDTETAVTQNAVMLSFGVVFTLTMLPMHRHYMLIAFPLMYLWLARLALCQPLGRRLLSALVIVQFAITLAFLVYVHQHEGPIPGDYGLPYRQQTEPRGE